MTKCQNIKNEIERETQLSGKKIYFPVFTRIQQVMFGIWILELVWNLIFEICYLRFFRYQSEAMSSPAPTENSGSYPRRSLALDISARECSTSPARKSR